MSSNAVVMVPSCTLHTNSQQVIKCVVLSHWEKNESPIKYVSMRATFSWFMKSDIIGHTNVQSVHHCLLKTISKVLYFEIVMKTEGWSEKSVFLLRLKKNYQKTYWIIWKIHCRKHVPSVTFSVFPVFCLKQKKEQKRQNRRKMIQFMHWGMSIKLRLQNKLRTKCFFWGFSSNSFVSLDLPGGD